MAKMTKEQAVERAPTEKAFKRAAQALHAANAKRVKTALGKRKQAPAKRLVKEKAPKLKPCPFCGGQPFCGGSDYWYFVQCGDNQCGVFTPLGERTATIMSWNKRTAVKK